MEYPYYKMCFKLTYIDLTETSMISDEYEVCRRATSVQLNLCKTTTLKKTEKCFSIPIHA